ncbi:MAG: fibronectin type III domain-containing protein [Candidatus Moduliflexus flocculans]|nr:fibronectin type III domain-containing protein [Candidatus Moduliflexus flocculans]
MNKASRRVFASLCAVSVLLLTHCKSPLLDSIKKMNDQYTATTVAPARPGAPTLTPATGQLTVAWTAVLGASGYEIYWGTVDNTAVASGPQAATASPSLISSLTNETLYYVWLRAVNSAGKEPI